MKTKKGISPLIATVLIIGFTIVLAALVMQWGTGLFEKIKGQTGISSEVSLMCSSGLTNLAVTGAEIDAINKVVKITVDNANEQDLSGVLLRWYDSDTGSVKTAEYNTPVKGFEVATIQISTAAAPDANTPAGAFNGIVADDEIGVMPKVKASDNSVHTCSNEKKITVA